MMYRNLNSVKRFRSYELFFFLVPYRTMRRAGPEMLIQRKSMERESWHLFSTDLQSERKKKEERRNSHRAENNFGEYRSSLKDRIRQKTFLLFHILDYRVLVSFFFLFFLCYINRMMFFDEK